jgi:hypothetical protein
MSSDSYTAQTAIRASATAMKECRQGEACKASHVLKKEARWPTPERDHFQRSILQPPISLSGYYSTNNIMAGNIKKMQHHLKTLNSGYASHPFYPTSPCLPLLNMEVET